MARFFYGRTKSRPGASNELTILLGGIRVRKYLLLFAPLLLLALLAGCDKPPVELSGIKRVAVMTLDNVTSRQELGIEIKEELLSQIPRGIAVEVIDGAAIENQLPRNGVEQALRDPARLAELGRLYGVDGFVVGTVTTYDEGHDGRLGLQWNIGQGLSADFTVEIQVSLSFNLRLVRAADGASLIYRQWAETSTDVLSFGIGRPFVSVAVSIAPHYRQLREAAINEAVRKLIREMRETKG